MLLSMQLGGLQPPAASKAARDSRTSRGGQAWGSFRVSPGHIRTGLRPKPLRTWMTLTHFWELCYVFGASSHAKWIRAGAVQPSCTEGLGAVSATNGAGGVVPPSRARAACKPPEAVRSSPVWGTGPLRGVSGAEAVLTLNGRATRLGGGGRHL